MQTIGDRISIIIRENSLKQSDFAKALNITPSSVSTMVSGKSNPSAQTIQQICDKFGYNRDWLVTGEGEPRSLAAADRQIVDALAHAMKFQSTAADRFIRAVAAAATSPGGDVAIQATVAFLEKLLAEYRGTPPPD